MHHIKIAKTYHKSESNMFLTDYSSCIEHFPSTLRLMYIQTRNKLKTKVISSTKLHSGPWDYTGP